MKISLKSFIRKIGDPPGTLLAEGVSTKKSCDISVVTYDPGQVNEKAISAPDEIKAYMQKDINLWVHVNGINDPEAIRGIGNLFDIHGLVLEDIMNTEHRPKLEVYDDHVFITLKSLEYNKEKQESIACQHSFLIGKGFLISFSENENGLFDPVRKRMANNKSKIRLEGTDYLLYALTDIIVDRYYVVADCLGESLEELEEMIFNEPSDEAMQKIHLLKNDILFLRKAINPLKEILNKINREETDFIQSQTTKYFSDVYDHVLHIIEVVDACRDISTGLKDLYLSSVSTRMNKVMQVLTVIATIFIPLTFVAGIYGMNFDDMPELHWKYGYFAVWGVMLAVAVAMLLFFRRRRWL